MHCVWSVDLLVAVVCALVLFCGSVVGEVAPPLAAVSGAATGDHDSVEQQAERVAWADAAAASPLRLCALFSDGRAGFVHAELGESRIVRAGETVWGYAVEDVDYDDDAVIMAREDARLLFAMEGLEIGRQKINLDALLIEKTNFEPTESELARGIDPNEPDTWPEDYKGPVIERFLEAKHADGEESGDEVVAEPLTEEEVMGVAAPKFEPTPEEAERGIDPNDPDTWPPDYLGPGIERMLKESGVDLDESEENPF